MNDLAPETGCSRRRVLTGAAGCAGAVLLPYAAAAEPVEETARAVASFVGGTPTPSDRVRLFMPRVFPNGYTVPLAFDVDSPMTAADHVASVHVLAPKNPLIAVATFHFAPGRSQARIATRIRLAEPQFVVAVAAMNDGALLMTRSWVDVASNGCK